MRQKRTRANAQSKTAEAGAEAKDETDQTEPETSLWSRMQQKPQRRVASDRVQRMIAG